MINYPSIRAQRRAKACIRREQNNKLAVATLILSGIVLVGIAIAISAIRVA